MPYTVFIDDNFHYTDEHYRYEYGVYDTKAAAIAVARAIVDEFLADNHKPGMSPDELFEAYTTFGDDPFIPTSETGVLFSAWTYAKERCAEICAGNKGN